MKKVLLSLLVLTSICVNAQRHRGYYNNPLQSEQPYYNQQVYQQPNRVKSNILPSIIGAIIGAAIVNSVSSNQYNNCDNQRFAIRRNYYQNQLEIERIQLLQMQVELLERQQYHREKRFLGIFPKRHQRNY